MDILIDPNIVDTCPFHLLPWGIGTILHAPAAIRLFTWGIRAPRAHAFGKGGFDGMEFNISTSGLFDPRLRLRDDKLALYKEQGWNIRALHACSSYHPPGLAPTELNPCIDDDRTQKLLRDNIRIAGELCAGKHKVLVLHPGHVDSPSGLKRGIASCIKNISDAMDLAEENGVIIALENLYHHNGGSVPGADHCRDLLHIADSVGSKNVGFTFDWGHANVAARDMGLAEKDLLSFSHQRDIVRALGKRIVHSHMHYNHCHKEDMHGRFKDNYVKRDEHLALTRIGEEDMPAWRRYVFALLEKSSLRRRGAITLEIPLRRVFGIFPVLRDGATPGEQMQSLRIMRKAVRSADA